MSVLQFSQHDVDLVGNGSRRKMDSLRDIAKGMLLLEEPQDQTLVGSEKSHIEIQVHPKPDILIRAVFTGVPAMLKDHFVESVHDPFPAHEQGFVEGANRQREEATQIMRETSPGRIEFIDRLDDGLLQAGKNLDFGTSHFLHVGSHGAQKKRTNPSQAFLESQWRRPGQKGDLFQGKTDVVVAFSSVLLSIGQGMIDGANGFIDFDNIKLGLLRHMFLLSEKDASFK